MAPAKNHARSIVVHGVWCSNSTDLVQIARPSVVCAARLPCLRPFRSHVGDTVRAALLLYSRRLLPLVIGAICLVAVAGALARTNHGGPLSGTWSGYIAGGGKRQHIVIVVNAKETGGSWKLGATCYGPLTLDSISNGYHHYRRGQGRGATCAGGDIDCLKPAGANIYDAVTSRLGGAYDSGGTLRRVPRK